MKKLFFLLIGTLIPMAIYCADTQPEERGKSKEQRSPSPPPPISAQTGHLPFLYVPNPHGGPPFAVQSHYAIGTATRFASNGQMWVVVYPLGANGYPMQYDWRNLVSVPDPTWQPPTQNS